MNCVMWILYAIGTILLLVLVICLICFRMAFYVSKKDRTPKGKYPIPDGEIYLPYKDQMIAWMQEVRAMPCKEYSIRSFDGLELHAKFYEYAPGAPIEIMFHGYRGSAERDLCGGIQRCFALQRSILLIDQRCSGKSQGRVITFGIREHQDCIDWANFAVKEFGPDVKLILTGISMGASTVLMAAGKELPENVIGVLADCGFSTAKDIICKVIRQMKLPVKLAYPFVRLAARIFGGFDLEGYSALEAMKNCKVPVIFFHGESDDFVPWQMSQENYDACSAAKKLVLVPGAGHGLGYLVEPEKYLQALRDFNVYWHL